MNEQATLVRERIDSEISAIERQIPEIEARLPEAQVEYDAAWDAWDEDARQHPDDHTPPEISARVDAASRQMFGLYDSIHAKRQRIERLEHPIEFESRMQTTQRIVALRERSNTMPKETAKDQGVPAAYLSEAGTFRIGMDARLKSDLVNAALGIESAEALHQFTPKQATDLLTKRGWNRFLDRKKEIIAAKEERAAEAAKAKEERARERAAEKEAKAKTAAEKKAEAKSAKAASGAKDTSTKGGPDPK